MDEWGEKSRGQQETFQSKIFIIAIELGPIFF
jgi:hypothetical protein